MTSEDFEQLLTEKDVIRKFKLKRTTLQQVRHHKRWPLRYLKIGRLVRYRESDIRAFLEASTKSGLEPEAPPPRKRTPKSAAKRGHRLLPAAR
ncbi:MAG: helix-turn-helix domain-containing protein [Candidatus Acidiferrales bacterium]